MGAGTVGVIVVSDYEAGEKTWKDERRVLAALAAQDTDEPFEVLLVENSASRHSVPDDLLATCPPTRIMFTDAEKSAVLKDFGVGQIATEFVAVFEADCVPNRAWLRVTLAALRAHPECAIVSGRTTYGDDSAYKRCLTAMDRSFLDAPRPGETSHVSNNGALYRRSVLAAFPYPDAVSPFASNRARHRVMAASGVRYWFEPEAEMIHAIGGLDFIQDFRRHTAIGDLAETGGSGVVERLAALRDRVVRDVRHIARAGFVRLRGSDLPLLAMLFVVAFASYVVALTDPALGKSGSSSYR